MLTALGLTDFRNHRATTLTGAARFNLLVGENGAGKTNVLEAISLLAPGRGLRRAALADMAAAQGQGGFAVSAALISPGADEPLRLGTGTTAAAPTRRQVRINGADASALALADWLAVFWLTPAMDRIFADSPGARRRLMDRMALALDPAHATAAARADAALRERNRLLSTVEEPDPRWLDALDAQFAEAGARVAQARAGLVERLEGALAGLPDAPFARPTLAYVAGGPVEPGALHAALAESRRRDRAARRTLVGPHRDELAVMHAAKAQPAAECSTGEQKAMLIALTLAHSDLASAAGPRLLLLDEVAAHLDPLRRAALVERLAATGAQVWITGTEIAPFVEALAGVRGETQVWHVAGGEAVPAGF